MPVTAELKLNFDVELALVALNENPVSVFATGLVATGAVKPNPFDDVSAADPNVGLLSVAAAPKLNPLVDEVGLARFESEAEAKLVGG